LPPGEACGFGAVGVDTREPLAVRVVYGYLPMTMLSTPVFTQCGALFGFLQGLFQFGSQKYLKVSSAAASTL
jgi:hypothetical protein